MKSCIYTGHVRHRRFLPVENSFRYRLFLMHLDLGELPTLFEDYWCWSYERVNLATFTRSYHLGDPQTPLDQAVRDLVEHRLGTRPAGPIRLLTHLRYFGYRFNPVSLYYCYDQADRTLETIVAEVNNTPWKEQHCYVLGGEQNEHPNPGWRRYQFAKTFHVSPFMDMDIWYDWRFQVPGKVLSVHMIDYEQGNRLFDATLKLTRMEISQRNLQKVLWGYPLMTLKVITLIHWQALRLWHKGATFYVHPAKRDSA
ncbi:DUF1365 family protein [candidate division KSB3 bacterium]|uniref:DUF1365 family protein n=1 Tax=candidate division KSB3 bacterium TaxID=2044937 RepID=A0A9D5Q6Z5_9BACT|nr:DUF1365 family protein [candidate division KSB3 bacterium]MBD3326384.1 DUF1365 family protein [candidate division KSB3 bacterium]